MTADNGYFLYYDKKYLSDVDVQTLDGILTVAAANEKKFTMDWSSGWVPFAGVSGEFHSTVILAPGLLYLNGIPNTADTCDNAAIFHTFQELGIKTVFKSGMGS